MILINSEAKLGPHVLVTTIFELLVLLHSNISDKWYVWYDPVAAMYSVSAPQLPAAFGLSVTSNHSMQLHPVL